MSWYGFDLDGTLVEHIGHEDLTKIGKPIPAMMDRLRNHLAAGHDCRIVTARANNRGLCAYERHLFLEALDEFCREHFGRELIVTCEKDFGMVCLYDDRSVQVVPNEGVLFEDMLAEAVKMLTEICLDDSIGVTQRINGIQWLEQHGFIIGNERRAK